MTRTHLNFVELEDHRATVLVLGEVPAGGAADVDVWSKLLPSIVTANNFECAGRYPSTHRHHEGTLPSPQLWRYLVDIDPQSHIAGSWRPR
jgi:hypothetical protein